ncbi:MAG: DUF4199 domain-containing protein [Acidobacteriota bacterium]
MKKTVLTFGLISGGIMTALMWAALAFIDRIGPDRGMIIGYTIIVLSSMLVFFGIRSYRENVGGGAITFGRAFAVGNLIILISCALYVITWETIYFGVPGFAEKFDAMFIAQAQRKGGTPEQIQAAIQQTKDFIVMYKNPFINAAFTFIEPFPIGLIVTLVSALILRKKKSDLEPGQTPARAAA